DRREGDRETEEGLRETGMGHRDREREPVEHGHAAEHALEQDREESEEPERTDRGTALAADHGPQGEHHGEAADERGGEPVAVLEEDPADHGWKDLPERQRPVGDGERGTGAGDEPAEEEEDKG